MLERVNEIQGEEKEINCVKEDVQKEFPELFTGLGKMENAYKITVDKNANPFNINIPHCLPIPMRKKVEEKLKKMEKQVIIRPVTEPTEWCAPIVAVPKENGKIRICVDFTRLNKSVQTFLFLQLINSWHNSLEPLFLAN